MTKYLVELGVVMVCCSWMFKLMLMARKNCIARQGGLTNCVSSVECCSANLCYRLKNRTQEILVPGARDGRWHVVHRINIIYSYGKPGGSDNLAVRMLVFRVLFDRIVGGPNQQCYLSSGLQQCACCKHSHPVRKDILCLWTISNSAACSLHLPGACFWFFVFQSHCYALAPLPSTWCMGKSGAALCKFGRV